MIKVSIIIPLYHGNQFIRYLIDLAMDNYNNLDGNTSVEVIIVNDSPDERVDVNWKLPFDIKLINNKGNEGIHQSRVNGLMASSGDFVTFWDQDDEWSDNFLKSQLEHIGDADVVLADAIYGNGIDLFKEDSVIEHILSPTWYIGNLLEIISPGQALIKRSSIPVEWTQHIMHTNYCDDAFLWVLMKDRHRKFAINPECLYTHTETGNNTSLNRKNNIVSLKELYDIVSANHLLSDENTSALHECIINRIKNNEEYIEVDNILSDKEKLRKILENFNRISVYGYGVNGEKLVSVMNDIGIHCSHIYDRGAASEEYNIEKLENSDDDSDLIIVSVINGRDDIIHWVKDNTNGEVISIFDIKR